MQDREGTKTSTLKGRERGWKDKVQACWLSYDWSQFPARMTIHDQWSRQWFSEEGKWQQSQSHCEEADKGERGRGGGGGERQPFWVKRGES